MKKFLFLILVVSIGPTATAQIKTAQAYYDYITDRSAVVELALSEFSNSLETDSAVLMYERLTLLAENCRSMVSYMETLEPFRGHTGWRDAVKDLYSYYGELCTKEFVQLIDYSLRLTVLSEVEFSALSEMMEKVTQVEIAKINEVNDQKDDFLKKFGPVKIKEPKD